MCVLHLPIYKNIYHTQKESVVFCHLNTSNIQSMCLLVTPSIFLFIWLKLFFMIILPSFNSYGSFSKLFYLNILVLYNFLKVYFSEEKESLDSNFQPFFGALHVRNYHLAKTKSKQNIHTKATFLHSAIKLKITMLTIQNQKN